MARRYRSGRPGIARRYPIQRRSARRQVLLRVDRLAVVANLEVDHVAVRAGAAHLGDLFTRLHALAFIHQALAVVAIGRQPLVAVLDDDQLAVADQAGAGIHHHAIGRGLHRLAAGAGDVDALLGRVAGHVTANDRAIGRPAPGDVALHRTRRCGGRRGAAGTAATGTRGGDHPGSPGPDGSSRGCPGCSRRSGRPE
ncbi:hypothetical protein G6F22_017688 [Rhizopus arrhizus]|nr:hypothetical protein G6F22_017688 [Rhizopus arrhizus]